MNDNKRYVNPDGYCDNCQILFFGYDFDRCPRCGKIITIDIDSEERGMSDSHIVDRIIEELLTREGFEWWWIDIDPKIREDIKKKLAEIIKEEEN